MKYIWSIYEMCFKGDYGAFFFETHHPLSRGRERNTKGSVKGHGSRQSPLSPPNRFFTRYSG